MRNSKAWQVGVVVASMMFAGVANAAQLGQDARSSIPRDVQQIIVVDYKAMQGSPAAMQLKDRVLPPELKRLETALKTSGLNINRDTETLAFAAFRAGKQGTRIIGVAQGQFQYADIMASFAKSKTKPVRLRNNEIYPMGSGGMSVVFLNQTTLLFGDRDAVRASLDARDGLAQNFLANSTMMSGMASVDSRNVWSLLDQRGTETMMKSVLGQAAQLPDYDTVKSRFTSASYSMDFSNGVRFDMDVVMSDSVTASTAAALMKGVMMMRQQGGTPTEKSALDDTKVDSNGSTLNVEYSSSDSAFAGLLSSPLFQSVVK